LELPSHMTKRSLYQHMLLELGWIYKYDSKGRVVERNAVEGEEQQAAPSWSSFYWYWIKQHPNLRIAGARLDVCNQCYVFANRHRYATRKKEEEDAVEQTGEQEQGPPPDGEDIVDGDEAVATMVRGEELVKTAARHVQMAQEQRLLYQDKRDEAIATKGLPAKERTLCYVADYAQNMYIPNFASEQPGATYYYSPMSAYVFGVVDASVDRLSAWIYTEDIAKKGGDNVASLLMHHLKATGTLQGVELGNGQLWWSKQEQACLAAASLHCEDEDCCCRQGYLPH
jgi:hypothetical protein